MGWGISRAANEPNGRLLKKSASFVLASQSILNVPQRVRLRCFHSAAALLDSLFEQPASRPCDITISDLEDRCAYRHGRSTMFGFVQRACDVVTPSRFSASGSRRGTALNDSSRDKPITELAEFGGAVAALQADPVIAKIYGLENAPRLAIQFVYNTCELLDNGIDIPSAFEATWRALVTESSRPSWRFAAVANLSNFMFTGDVANLGHGVSVQGRSFDRLRQELGFDQADLDVLAEDWSAGGAASSYVLVVETSQPKTPANFILSSDGAAYPLASRALLAMRLLGAGAPHFGRMFLKRPAAFNTGIGDRSYARVHNLVAWCAVQSQRDDDSGDPPTDRHADCRREGLGDQCAAHRLST